MHSLNLPNGVIVQHNGDFSGEVKINIPGKPEITIRYNILKAIVAEDIRSRRMIKLENMTVQQLIN